MLQLQFQEGMGDFLSTITACNSTKAKQLINIFEMQYNDLKHR